QPLERWNFNLHEQTVFFETRTICGSETIFKAWQGLLDNYWRTNGHREKLFRSVKQDYENFLKTCLNNPAEPDLKRDFGGIREYTFLYWLAAIAGKTIPQVLKPEEYKIFRQALEFLWLLRDAVHHVSGRDENKLTKNLQTKLPMALNLEKLQILMHGMHQFCFFGVQKL
ncbi:MAG: hypothetical protein Q7S68_04840, partial [Deltaproteobacteria bacterium]|nr:hypothetical protein [Deltaproteobacteria bacterium]